MTARSQARDEAVVALLGLGWSVERIRQALGITEDLARRLVRQAQPPSAVAGCAYKLGSRRGHARYCDAPVRVAGEVFCAAHYRSGWPQRASAE